MFLKIPMTTKKYLIAIALFMGVLAFPYAGEIVWHGFIPNMSHQDSSRLSQDFVFAGNGLQHVFGGNIRINQLSLIMPANWTAEQRDAINNIMRHIDGNHQARGGDFFTYVVRRAVTNHGFEGWLIHIFQNDQGARAISLFYFFITR